MTRRFNRRFIPSHLSPVEWNRGDFVDKSTDFVLLHRGGTRHHRQATPAVMPVIAQSPTGKPVIRFNGTDQHLVADTAAAGYTFLHDATGSEVHFVITPQSLATSWWGFGDYAGGAAWQILRGGAANDLRLLISNNAAGATIDYTLTGALIVGVPVYVSAYLSATNSPNYAVYKNGVLLTSGSIDGAARNNASAQTMQTGRRTNGTAYAQIDLHERVLLNRVLSDSQRARMATYFMTRHL